MPLSARVNFRCTGDGNGTARCTWDVHQDAVGEGTRFTEAVNERRDSVASRVTESLPRTSRVEW
jgi:hypothetical protein